MKMFSILPLFSWCISGIRDSSWKWARPCGAPGAFIPMRRQLLSKLNKILSNDKYYEEKKRAIWQWLVIRMISNQGDFLWGSDIWLETWLVMRGQPRKDMGSVYCRGQSTKVLPGSDWRVMGERESYGQSGEIMSLNLF